MLNRLNQYFTDGGTIPDNASESFRIKILLSSCLATSLLASPFLIYWGIISRLQSPQFLLLLALVVTLLSAPFLYKLTRSLTIAGLYTNVVSIWILIFFTWIDGGFYSPALIWYPILPLFAGFYAGLRYSVGVTAVLVASLFVMYAGQQYGLVPNPRTSESTLVLMYLGSATAVTLLALNITKNFVEWSFAVHSELIRANEAKNEFLSGVSHELRTPLNSILGFSEVLSEGYAGELSGKQLRYAEHIHTSGKHLLSLVDDLLDITKIESGKTDFKPRPVNVAELIQSSMEMLRGSALKKEISLCTELGDRVDSDSVVMDEIKMKQVLINLVGNAIKFTPRKGSVSLSAKLDNDKLVLEIVDSGPGVPEKYHQSVFERFFQLNRGSENKDPGAGLGLTICKHIVDMHGGYIYLRESLRGAHFVCELPTTLKTQTSN